MTAEELRARLTTTAGALDQKMVSRLAVVEWWRPLAAIGTVIGALVVAFSRIVSIDSISLGLAVGGSVFTATCGVAIALMDYRKFEISTEAKTALSVAEEALSELANRETELANASQRIDQIGAAATDFDAKRNSRIQALRLMIDVAEAAFLKNWKAQTAAKRLLQIPAAALRGAIDWESRDFLTITIFRAGKDKSGAEVMKPIAREWTDSAASAGGRAWPKGRGYTGVLWSLACGDPKASVVEPDTSLASVKKKYPVDNPDPDREDRYRSVASYPILIGKDNEVWGIVTATSSRKGVFDHEGRLPRQSAEAIRDVALIASLLVKLDLDT